jgi:hypothetical protein
VWIYTKIDQYWQVFALFLLISLFIALDPGKPRNSHQNQMFILTVDLVHHFHNLGAANFFITFRGVRQLSESLSIPLFDCSEVFVMLMALFIASASTLNIENGLCNCISLTFVGMTTVHPTLPCIFDPSIYIYLSVVQVVPIQGFFQKTPRANRNP